MIPFFLSNDTKGINSKSKITNPKQAPMFKIQNLKQDETFGRGGSRTAPTLNLFGIWCFLDGVTMNIMSGQLKNGVIRVLLGFALFTFSLCYPLI